MPISTEPRVYRFGLYEADMRSGELRKNGMKLKLQGQPFEVLGALLERPGEVVTRDELRERLWPADTFVDFDHSLNTAINKVRDVLGDNAANPRFVETLAKRGYRFIAPVRVVGPTPAIKTEPSVNEAHAPDQAASPEPAEKQPTPPVEPAPAGTQQANNASEAGTDAYVNRNIGRGLFSVIQVMYLCFYLVSMWKLVSIDAIAVGITPGWARVLLVIIIVSAVLGIPTRLYLLTAVLFDYRRIGANFERIFPFVLPLDELWALSPFLLQEKIGFGLAFAATAALVYLPFSQRTLMRMTYGSEAL
jgi:cholera toxin transcriptional activator